MNKIKKLKIAVTGGIGSGKSEFCNYLESNGLPVINVDDVSKEILVSDESVKEKIIEEFGEESFISGNINKKYLAEKVFSVPSNVVKINSIVHPKVIKKVEFLINEELSKNTLVFAEAALIYEADMEDMFDYVVLISADEKIRMKRKVEFSNFTEDDFRKRNENQIKDEEKKKRADFTFINDGSLEELKIKAELFLKILNGLSQVND